MIQQYINFIFGYFTIVYILNILEFKKSREHFLQSLLPSLIGMTIGFLYGTLSIKYNIPYKYDMILGFSLLSYVVLYYYNKLNYTEPSPGEAPSLPPEKIYMERKKDMKNKYPKGIENSTDIDKSFYKKINIYI